MILRIIFLFIALFPNCIWGQNEYFQNLVNSAYKNNFYIKSYKEYLNSIKKNIDIATGNYYPKIDFSYKFIGTKEPSEAAFLKAKQGRLSMGYYYKYMANPPFVKDHQFIISLLQPIFSKGKIGLSKKQAKLNYEAGELSFKEVKREIKFRIFKVLINVNKLFENIKIAENMKKRAEIYLKTIENFYKNGKALKSDYFYAKYHLKQAEINLETLKNTLNKFKFVLKELTGKEFPLKKVNFEISKKLDIQDLINFGIENRDDIKAFKNYIKIAEIEIKKRKNNYLPEIYGFANYEKNSEDFFNNNKSGYTIGVGIKFNIFNGMIDKNRILQAKYNLMRMKNLLYEKEEALKREIRNSYIDFINAQFTYNSLKKLVNSNKIALEISEKRFSQGLERITTLVDMETNYKNSLYKLNEAKWDMVLKYYTILYKAGKF